jgi:SLT domain-containing protein
MNKVKILFLIPGSENNGTTGMMILANFDRTRELNMLDFHSNQKITQSDWQWAFFKVCLTVYKNGVDYNLKSRTDIFSCWRNSTTTPNLWNINNKTIIINFKYSYYRQ